VAERADLAQGPGQLGVGPSADPGVAGVGVVEADGQPPGRTWKLRSSMATVSPRRLVSVVTSIMVRPYGGRRAPTMGLSPVHHWP
jgi:hypothetical protein